MSQIEFLFGCFKIYLFKIFCRGIQLHAKEIRSVYQAMRKYPSCQMLIFGLGHDSLLWHSLNKKGRTVFIEEDQKWFARIKRKHPFLEAYHVPFSTKVSQWRDSIKDPERLRLNLPASIEEGSLDLILVDGPSGYKEDCPGRGSSIYMSRKLIASGGAIFVHDSERPLEEAFCSAFLGKERVCSEIQGRALLRYYQF